MLYVGDDVCAPQQELDDDSKDCRRRSLALTVEAHKPIVGIVGDTPGTYHISKVCLSMPVDMIGTASG